MNTITKFAEKINKIHGDVWFVGGVVRDEIMGQPSIDIDLVLTGVSIEQGVAIMKQFSTCEVKQVVSIAPVFMVQFDGQDIEIAFARREISTGDNKEDFTFQIENISIEEDLMRRDFTINAIAKHVLSGKIVDPFNGRKDIANKVLRHVSDAFSESPERVFRLASFAARFNFSVDKETIEVCQAMPIGGVPKEQVWRHIHKAFSKAVKPSNWVQVLINTNWVGLFPEIKNMIGLEQDNIWHPEGDVITHTMMVMDEAAKLATNNEERFILVLTALCHDMGKVDTTFLKDDRIVSPGHEDSDLPVKFLQRINAPNKVQEIVITLVKMHMRHHNGANKRIVRRILRDLDGIDIILLGKLVSADHSGRFPLPKGMPDNMQVIMTVAEEMVNAFVPLITGKDLINLGEKPGKHFGHILEMCANAQIEGLFETKEDGLVWVKRILE